jgi:hypothetical protein
MMLGSFFRPLFIVFVVCCALIGGVRLLSPFDPPRDVAALLPDPACPAPCWRGFAMDKVTVDQVLAWVQTRPADWRVTGYTPTSRSGRSTHWEMKVPDIGTVMIDTIPTDLGFQTALRLMPHGLRLGDMLVALGEPDRIDFHMGKGFQSIVFWMHYDRHQLDVMGMTDEDVLEPRTPVSVLVYQAPPWGRSFAPYEWRGFGSLDDLYFRERP